MGGKSQPAPDYSGMESVAREQLRFSKQQYADMRPIVEQISQSQIAAQEQQMQQAGDYYQYQQETFRPLEQGLVAQAQEFNTDAYRQAQAQEASAAAARAFGTARDSTARYQAARGVNPASGAARGAGLQTQLQEAAMRAQGMTGARNQAQQLGYARQLDAAGLGRGLAGASAAAYSGAVGAGSQASNVAQSAGNNYQAGLAGAGQTYGNLASTQASVYSAGLNATGEMMGAALGAGATAYASDMRLKENVSEVGKDAYTGLNLYHFSYINDPDSTMYEGVMAQEVLNFMPEAVVLTEDGFYAVDYNMLGLEMKQVEVA
jgi:hypothetical protein